MKHLNINLSAKYKSMKHLTTNLWTISTHILETLTKIFGTYTTRFFFISILFISIIRLESGRNKHNLSIAKAQILSQGELKNVKDIERVQKSALKLILAEKYKTYKNALNILELESLEDRRKVLCLEFAKKCLNNAKMKSL